MRDTVVQPHDIHSPAANVRKDHGGFIEQITVLEDRRIALRKQLHILHGNLIRNPFIQKRDRLALAQQICPECFLFPAEARQRQARREDHRRCSRRVPVCDLFGNGRQRQQIVILIHCLILLERLPPAADNVVFSVIAEDVFLRVRFMLVFCQAGRERAMRGFHGRVAMIHANGNGFCHRSSTFSFRLFISFCGARSSGSSFPKPSLRSVFSYSFFSNARYSGDV